jgi:PAS domain-containing protein
MTDDTRPADDWPVEFPGAVTVCDRSGVILSMNDRSAAAFDADGGRALIGHNLLDCHPEPARSQCRRLWRTTASCAGSNGSTVRNGKIAARWLWCR